MIKLIKCNKKLFLGFIIGVMFSSITVYAATKYLASDVSFKSAHEEWNVSNVEDALNDLYKNQKSKIILNYNLGSNKTNFTRMRTDFNSLSSLGYSYYKILTPEVIAGSCRDIYFTKDWDNDDSEKLELNVEYPTSQNFQAVVSGSAACFYRIKILLYN